MFVEKLYSVFFLDTILFIMLSDCYQIELCELSFKISHEVSQKIQTNS